jgi:hypothetical protein
MGGERQHFSTLMKALIKNPKTKRMIEAGNFSHVFQIIKVLERRYNTHTTKRRNRLSRWLFTRSNKKQESLALSSLIVLMLLR